MKAKTNSTAKKRFKRTAGGKGKLMQKKSAKNHRLSSKSKRAKNAFAKGKPTSPTNRRRVLSVLPNL